MKRNWIKRAMMVIALVMVGFGGAYAQEAGDLAVGAHFADASRGDYSNMGVGAKLRYNVIYRPVVFERRTQIQNRV